MAARRMGGRFTSGVAYATYALVICDDGRSGRARSLVPPSPPAVTQLYVIL